MGNDFFPCGLFISKFISLPDPAAFPEVFFYCFIETLGLRLFPTHLQIMKLIFNIPQDDRIPKIVINSWMDLL